jgi:hypothetical protein
LLEAADQGGSFLQPGDSKMRQSKNLAMQGGGIKPFLTGPGDGMILATRSPRRCAVMKRVTMILVAAAWLVRPCGDARGFALQGEAGLANGRFGAAISELEDQNGDGRSELLIGAPELNAGGSMFGRVYLWYGRPAMTAAANLVFSGTQTEQFGFAVARVGDVNGDGHPDFAVGAPLNSVNGLHHGRVYVFFGGPGLDATPDAILDYPGSSAEPEFGFALAALGDFNGDNVDDFAVGAPYGDATGLNAGEVYVYYGSANATQLAASDLTLTGAIANDHFGWSIGAVTGFFRDGRPALLAGAPANESPFTRAGRVYLYRGAYAGHPVPDATSDLDFGTSAASVAGTFFGYSVRGVGDWNGDGAGDFAVGAPGDDAAGLNAGRVEIFFGGTSPDALTDRVVTGEHAGDELGTAVAAVGDVLGSGLPDLLIGAPGYSTAEADAGRAYLYAGGSAYQGSASGLTAVPATGVSTGAALANDRFGTWVSSAGDIDGDGTPDTAVGAPTGNIANNQEAGYAQVYDSSQAVVPNLLLGWTASWQGSGEIRLTFALSEPPESFRALELWRQVGSATPTLACAGDPASSSSCLELRDGRWILTDRPGPLAAGLTLSYALALTSADPFNPRTVLTFRAPGGSSAVCRVLDLRGRTLATLFDGAATGGWQTAVWDGTSAGHPVPAGVYTIQVSANGQSQTRRVVLAK